MPLQISRSENGNIKIQDGTSISQNFTGNTSFRIVPNYVKSTFTIYANEKPLKDHFKLSDGVVINNVAFVGTIEELEAELMEEVFFLTSSGGGGGEPTTDASALTTGTLSNARLADIPQSKIDGLVSALAGKATTADISSALSALVDSSPATLNTLNELAAALGDDPDFATTITTLIGTKANTSSLSTVATSGSYNDLSSKPTIPTNTNQLTNGAGFISDLPAALEGIGDESIPQSKVVGLEELVTDVEEFNLPTYTDLGDAGSAIKAITFQAPSLLGSNFYAAEIYTGVVYYVKVILKKAETITGVKLLMETQGAYTAGTYNGVGLYSVAGTTLTKVASSANDGNIWKATSGSVIEKAFTAPYEAEPGEYYVSLLYQNSASVTPPKLMYMSVPFPAFQALDFTSGRKICSAGYEDSEMPATKSTSTDFNTTDPLWVAIY